MLSQSSTSGYNAATRRNGIVLHSLVSSCQERRNGIVPDPECRDEGKIEDTPETREEVNLDKTNKYDDNNLNKVISTRIVCFSKPALTMKKVLANPAFRHTFTDSSDFKESYTDRSLMVNKSDFPDCTNNNNNSSSNTYSKKVTGGRKKQKSQSLDGGHSMVGAIPECVNPAYLNHSSDSIGGSIDIEGCVTDHTCTDALPSDDGDDISVFSDITAQSAGDYDVGGLQGRSLYPWQREAGIQCNLVRVSSVDRGGVKDQQKKVKGSFKLKLLKSTGSLDSSQKICGNPMLKKRLDKIRELEYEAARNKAAGDQTECTE